MVVVSDASPVSKKIANSLGIKTVGVLGVLLKAKSEGLIPEVASILNDLEKLAGFWMSESLRKEVLFFGRGMRLHIFFVKRIGR